MPLKRLLCWGMFLLATIHPGSARVSAGLVFYTNEAAFDAASTALSSQTFANANVAKAGYSIIGNPLNSSTNNAVFSTGSMLSGLSISSSAEHAGQDLVAAAPGLFGNASKSLYNNYGGDSLDTSFSAPATAVGMGLLSPNGTAVDFIVDSTSGARLGIQTVTVVSAGATTFFGVVATNGDQIGQIELLGHATNGMASQGFAGIDRVVFNSVSTAAVPEPGSLALVSLGLACLFSRRLPRVWKSASARE